MPHLSGPRSLLNLRLPACLLALGLSASDAVAAEVQFEGFYRARFRVFDTLSLNRQLATSEGTALGVQHRLWLQPRFVLNDNVSLYTEIKALDNVYWGTQQMSLYDPTTGTAPAIFVDDLSAPTSAGTTPLDLTIWRAWGQIDTKIGRFSFGRMPLQWGMGIWQNNGLGPMAEYGDTTDRVQWEHLIQNQFFVSLAADVTANSFVNVADDTWAFNGLTAYRSETVEAGINLQYRTTPSLGLNLFTADLAADATLGKISLQAEAIGQFGAGDALEDGTDNPTITAFGAVTQVGLDLAPWTFELQGGFASGDANPADAKIRSFTFDRDFNPTMMLFERPLPTLAAAVPTDVNGGRALDVAQTGYALSNALYLRPRIARRLRDDLEVELTWFGARAAKLPEVQADRNRYGMEFGLGATYAPFTHFVLYGNFGVLIPGTHFSNYSDDTFSDFDDAAFGGQLAGRIRF